MKKIILLLWLVLGSLITANACPICGCGGGNLYVGLFPDFSNQFIGVRYHYACYHTQLANDPTQFSTNYYQATEFWGGVNLGKRFKVMAFVPYYFNKQIDDDGTSYKNGLGDITLLGQYQLVNVASHRSGNKVFRQQLWIGGGIKIATGTFNINPTDTNTTIADINAQLGTGSTDFLLNGLYTITVDKFGLSTSATYKINTINNNQYKYGNKFSANSIAFYRIMAAKCSISPNIGIGYESVSGNTLDSKKVQYTGSHVTTAIIGVEFNRGHIGMGVNAQIPAEQNFAEGQTLLKVKAMAHITVSF